MRNVSCIEPDSAIYIESGDVEGFSGAIIRLFTDAEPARKLGERIGGYVKAFRNIRKVTEAYVSVYESLVRR